MTDRDNNFLLALYNEMFKILFAVAISQVKDFHLSEELVQETFLIATSKIDDVIGSLNPQGWLRNTLNNLIKHEFRTRSRIAQQVISIETLSDSEQPSKPSDSLEEIKSIFTRQEWEMLHKAYIEGYTITELADELGINYDTCRKRLTKIKGKLNLADE